VHRKPLRNVRREVDLIFAGVNVAVFIDGCFWHGCPRHGSMPKANRDLWRQKIEGNRERDMETNALLRKAGWRVVRVWEHEIPRVAARRIARVVAGRLSSRNTRGPANRDKKVKPRKRAKECMAAVRQRH
jgi:DNA mismatch endonuclease (patch repair protein)